MIFKRWLMLLVVYVGFMVAGAVMFLYLEVWFELQQRRELQLLKREVIELVTSLDNSTRGDVEDVLGKVGEECGHDFLELLEDAPLTWTLWNSFFFTFTVITTIGFGHMAPKTTWGRVACICYAFIGVPLNGILIASLADIFSSKVINMDLRQWASRYKSWVTVLVDSIVFLVPGLVVFLVIPSLVLMAVEEGWTYLDAFYFSFITLTTIGFGDHVAGQQERDHVWVWVYKIVMVVWIIFGLGYIIMIITFVQKALKSKKILNLEKKMASALKKHVVKVHKDLGTVRRAINSTNRVSPEDDDETLNKKRSQAASLKLQSVDLDLETKQLQSRPRTEAAPIRRLRSASESDLSMPYVTHREELEGMNAMLDFIERLLHHQESRALTTFNSLLHHHHHHHHQAEGAAEESEPKISVSKALNIEEGCDNSGFVQDADDFGDLRPLGEGKEALKDHGGRWGSWGKGVTPSRSRKRSNAEELLYLMLMKSETSTAASTAATTAATATTPTSPPPYESLPFPLTPTMPSTPSHHNLTVLTQFFQRHSRGMDAASQLSPPRHRPCPLLPRLPAFPNPSPQPPQPPRDGEKEFTKL